MARRITLEEARKEYARHGHQLLADVYINSYTEMPYRCGGCGKIPQKGMNLDAAKRGNVCWACGVKKRSYSHEEAVEVFQRTHGHILLEPYPGDCKIPLRYQCGVCRRTIEEGLSLDSAKKGSLCRECGIQKRSRSKGRKYDFQGRQVNLAEYLRLSKSPVPLKVVHQRMKRDGIPLEEAIKDENRLEHLIEYDGEMISIKEAAKKQGIPYTRLQSRILKGMPVDEALSLPNQREGLYKIYDGEPAKKMKDWWTDPRRGVTKVFTFYFRLRIGIPLRDAFECRDNLSFRYMEVNGRRLHFAAMMRELGIVPRTFLLRLKRGLSPEQAAGYHRAFCDLDEFKPGAIESVFDMLEEKLGLSARKK